MLSNPSNNNEMNASCIYPLMACLSSLSLFAIALLQIPQAVKTNRYNRCVDQQIKMRLAINPQGGNTPGKLNYLKAIEHCEGR